MRHGKHVKKIQYIITNKLGIESDVEVDRCHRIGPRKKNRPRSGPITYRCFIFNRYKDKQRILNDAKKLKNTGIFMYECFSKELYGTWKVTLGARFRILETK